MPLREAHHICPAAFFVPLDETKYRRSFDELLDILELFSPTVETGNLGKAFIDGAGLAGLYGHDKNLALLISSEIHHRTHLESTIGIGSSKFVAEVAARMSSYQQPRIVRRGREKEFLEPLPASLLPVSGETQKRFDLLGLRTMGQIAPFPWDALANQFGEEGILAHQLAHGIDNRPLMPRAKLAILEDELSCENPLDSFDVLLSALDRLLNRLIPALKSRNQMCGQVMVCLCLDRAGLWSESFNLKEPSDSKLDIFNFLKHRLESMHLQAGITGIRLGLTQLGGESVKQESLLHREKLRQDEQLKKVAKRLQVRLGRNPLKKVVQVDPLSRIPERRSALIDLNL
jgi:nucleotidyltransferase/DNA polymerase involved in DNA repair